MHPLLFSLFSHERIAAPLTETLRGDLGTINIRRFPDGESYVRYETSVEARDVVLVCTLDRPDDKFLPLIFAAAAARENGAKTIGAGCALSCLYAAGPALSGRRGRDRETFRCGAQPMD